ncbi:MAG: type II toxin-antitoxin system RelE/ParE family toxin [Erythrobacter sp.]|nr:type II toxin-antitoxin system RelE/ParE family toxin [Erythrobacter sp.]NCQ64255.1 type II toxin-antitoxin system RelE/ParE family toxin [Alphaproteobacteria bacterium]
MIEIKQQALDDLREIADHIARDSPDRAESFVAGMLDRIVWVGENPRLYPVRLQWKTGLRSANYGRYRILYRSNEDDVVFLRIVHTSRDIAAIIEETE